MTTTTDVTASDRIEHDARVGHVLQIPTTQLRASMWNPRQDHGDLDELGASLRQGQITDLLVYPSPDVDGDFEVLDGHRRLAAARRAQLDTLSCKVVAAPASTGDAVATMVTAGRTGKPLSQSEIAHGVQTMFNLGLDEDAVRRKARLSAEQVFGARALAAAPRSVQEYADAQGSFEAAILLAQAREEFAGDEVLANIERAAEEDPRNVAWRVRNARADRDRRAFQELLDEAGVQSPPSSLLHMQYPGVDGADREWTPPLEEVLARPREEVLEEMRERVEAGWTCANFNGGRAEWYPKRAKATKAQGEPEPELTDEERAAMAARDEARLQLTEAGEQRDAWAKDLLAKAEPAPGLKTHRIVQDLCMATLARYRHSTVLPRLLGWAGLPETKDPGQWDEIVVPAAERAFAKKKVGWMVVFLALVDRLRREEVLRSFRDLDGSPWSRADAAEHVEWLESRLGFEPSEQLTAALAYVGREDLTDDGELQQCGECGQTVSTGQDWDGLCESCADGSEA